MKIFHDKRFLVFVILSGLAITAIATHGCGITSYEEGGKVASLSIEPVNNTAVGGVVTIAAQTAQQFKATGLYSNATTTDLSASVVWSTSDASVATVSSAGLATAVAPSGTCTITATGSGVSASIKLTIKNLALQTITISPSSVSSNIGLTQQFTATGLFSNGTDTIPSQDITTLVSWSSSTTSVATIDPHSGLATCVASGTTHISAQLNGVTSSPATLTIASAALQSISITAAGPARVGMPPVQLTATGTFADNSSQDMTSQVVWSSETPNVATVSSSGLLTPVSPGHATIKATAGNITGSVTLTIYAAGGH